MTFSSPESSSQKNTSSASSKSIIVAKSKSGSLLQNSILPGASWELMVASSAGQEVSSSVVDSSDWHPERLLERCQLLNYLGKYSESSQLLDEIIKHLAEQPTHILCLQAQVEQTWVRFLQSPDKEGSQTLRRLDSHLQVLQKSVQHKGSLAIKANLLYYKGVIHSDKQNYGLALRFYREALTYTDSESLQAAKIYDSMAKHYERTGSFAQASQLLRHSLQIKESLGIIHEQAHSNELLGQLALVVENVSEAEFHTEKALALAKQLNDTERVGRLNNELLKICILNKQLKKAEALIVQLELDNKELKHWVNYATTLVYKAFLKYRYHEFEESYELLSMMALPLLENYTNEVIYGVAYRLLGALCYTFGRRREALEHLVTAITVFKRLRNHTELAKTFFEQGKLYHDMNHYGLAEESLLRALRLAELNGLSFILRSIEEELYVVAPNTWQQLMQQRAERGSSVAFKKKEEPFAASEQAHLATTNDHEQTANLAENPEAAAVSLSIDEALDSESEQDRFQGVSPEAFSSLFRLGLAISAERDLDNILHIIREETTRALNAERCTVFVYDAEKDELWSKVASGFSSTDVIRIPAGTGLAGHVLRLGEALNIPDVYQDPRFNKEVDRKTGYRTTSLLCMPIHNRTGEPISVIQVLNKRNGPFVKSDEDLLLAISATASMTMENTLLAAQQKQAFESFVITLSSAIDARDRITSGHSKRVANYAVLIGEEMHLSSDENEALRYAALLHDIGKIGIREEVLTKEGRLTVAEYKHIQEHARYTYEILQHIHFPKHLKNVPFMAATHHERVDGKGYFSGLKGEEIPMGGRIIALTDVFDAITSLRHYRNRMPFENVLKIFRKDSGSHFDTEVVELFFRIPLHRLAKVLVQDQQHNKLAEVASLVPYLDKSISIADYEQLLGKTNLSNAEQKLHTVFSDIYYVLPNRSKLDNE
ncbi:MAG: HD domain-containing phosphohydrolase [Vampirovibrionales bacterium]